MNNLEGNRSDPLRQAAAARLAEVTMAAISAVSASALRSATRQRRPVAQARQMAMYLAHVALGLSLTRVGVCFGRDRTTVRHACALIEDRRDDPAVEFALTAIEAGLGALSAHLRLATVEPRR